MIVEYAGLGSCKRCFHLLPFASGHEKAQDSGDLHVYIHWVETSCLYNSCMRDNNYDEPIVCDFSLAIAFGV